MEIKYNAIILGKIDVGETDRIYSAYTKEAGKVRLLAKGVRKPNAKLAGNLESLMHSEIFVAKGRGNGKITGAIGVDSFLGIKENISALERVFYVVRIFDRLVTQEEKDENIFHLLLNYLRAMDKSACEEDKLEIFTLGFAFKLLESLGYALRMKKCAGCSASLLPGENYFSAPRGGVLCPACSRGEMRKVKVNDETIKFIRIFSENKMGNLGKLKADKKSFGNLKIVLSEAVRWIS